MKRLITIFLSSIVGIGLWAQTETPVPMAIFGDVYVGNGGNMKSVGPVHLEAHTDGTGAPQYVGRVANYGNVDASSIIFYSDSLYDGLLMNEQNVTATEVRVRKPINRSNYWYMMSFPFDVNFGSGGLKLYDSENPNAEQRVLVYNEDFMIQRYDPQKRADSGKNEDANWVNIRSVSGTANPPGKPNVWDNDLLPAGTPCRIAVKLTDTTHASIGRFSVDFYANPADPTTIAKLFDRVTKGADLTYAYSTTLYDPTHACDGWNAVGGFNSTNFIIRDAEDVVNRTIKYNVGVTSTSLDNKTIYYRIDRGNGLLEWLQIDPEIEKGTLRPYSVIFVKTDAGTNLLRDAGGLDYYYNGVALSNDTAPRFRSLQSDYSKDVFGLYLTDVNEPVKQSHIYFKFKDDFSKFFKPAEDGMALQLRSTYGPIIWSYVPVENMDVNANVFSNSLPKETSEVALGFSLPARSVDYVVSMEEIANETFESVILWDKVANRYTDLLKEDYRFRSGGNANDQDANGSYDLSENSFVLFFNRVMTSLPSQIEKTSDVYAFAENNILTVKNLLPGDKVQVSDLTGRTIVAGVASGNAFTTSLNQKGIYIVNIRGGKTLKVLNK